MSETTLGEIRALAEDSDPNIADPPNIRLLTGPLNPGSDPNFFDLTANDDIVLLAMESSATLPEVCGPQPATISSEVPVVQN